jgi:hypothetical protein
MRRLHLITMACLVSAIPLLATGQEKKKPEAPAAQAFQEALEEAARPVKEHTQLARLAGEWKTQAKMYIPDPAKPEITEGTATYRMIMGGRYLRQDLQGQFAGKPYRGLGILGYDKNKKKFVDVWIDSMGTGIMTMEGEYDEKKHELVETGVSIGPQGEEKFKLVSRYLDENKFEFSMYMVQPDGAESKVMDITYTRVSGPEAKKP